WSIVGWVERSETHHGMRNPRWVSLRSTHPTKSASNTSASNHGDSSLDILGQQLPRLGSGLGISAKPNEHVVRQRDALASIVLVYCEIAHRRIDHLKQNVLGG